MSTPTTPTPDAPITTPAPTPAPSPAAPAPEPSPAPVAASGDGLDFFSAIDKALSPKEADPTPEPPAPEPTPAAADPAKDKVVSPKAKDFEIIKAQREEARQEAAKLAAQLKELQDKLQQTESTVSELPTIKEKAELYEKELAAVRLEHSPEYAAVVTEPSVKIRNEADRLALKYKLDRSRLADALAESDPSAQNDLVSELASSMNQRDQFTLFQLVDDFNVVLAKREELRQNAQAAWAEIQANRAREAEQAQERTKQEFVAAEKEVWGALESKIPDLAKLPTLAEIKSKATRPLAEMTGKEQVYSAAAGHLLPIFVEQAHTRAKRIAELEEALAKYTQASPSAGGGSAPAPEPDTMSGGFLDRIEQRLHG